MAGGMGVVQAKAGAGAGAGGEGEGGGGPLLVEVMELAARPSFRPNMSGVTAKKTLAESQHKSKIKK